MSSPIGGDKIENLYNASFKTKQVFFLECAFCWATVCKRAMKAVLLADSEVELFSTDAPERGNVDVVSDEAYYTDSCKCLIENVACVGCGNVIGYHVQMPCKPCLSSCNNGHFWMYNRWAVLAVERLNSQGNEVMLWENIPEEHCDNGYEMFTEECVR